jgi:predicted alpha/beta hydrolase
VNRRTITLQAADGVVLTAHVWRHADHLQAIRPVVIVNPATSVRCSYYARFAAFLHQRGFDVITYDYRGIGDSRPATLRGFRASWLDWGRQDFEAALRFAVTSFPGQPVQVVAHSVGGFLVGLAPSNSVITRVFSVGAQFAHWRDYADRKRLAMLMKWHVAMPLLTRLFGYFPGRRLGWMEDTPSGVVRDWTHRSPRFEETWLCGPQALTANARTDLVAQFAAMRAPMLALGMSDDEFGTVSAIQRLLAYFTSSQVTHLQLSPESIGHREVGHFAFFHSRFEATLWQIALDWLQQGTLRAEFEPYVVALPPRSAPAT